MKKILLVLIGTGLFFLQPLQGQLGGVLRRVQTVVENEITGENNEKPAPEPDCACDDAGLVFELGGELDIDYTEIGISAQDDGSLLVSNRGGNEFYIVRNGAAKGPYTQDDSEIAKYKFTGTEENDSRSIIERYSEYISRKADKLLITFGGQTYGPYAQINEFIVTLSKDKFLAMVVEDVLMTEDAGKQLEKAMANAKTDQEKMALAMQYSQMMSSNMMNSSGQPKDLSPKAITNIVGSTYSLMSAFGGQLNGTMKYNEILVVAPDRIMDLNGKTLFTFKNSDCSGADMFVSSTNSRYACYNYGTLTFSDNTVLSELFNPRLVNQGGKTFLSYMYYSPKRNSVMECKIPF